MPGPVRGHGCGVMHRWKSPPAAWDLNWEPLYDVMLAWDPEAMPAEWETAGRKRYFAINWVQLVATWAAFGLFLLALIQL